MLSSLRLHHPPGRALLRRRTFSNWNWNFIIPPSHGAQLSLLFLTGSLSLGFGLLGVTAGDCIPRTPDRSDDLGKRSLATEPNRILRSNVPVNSVRRLYACRQSLLGV
ncbi:hypothetical protein BDW75DRAFT_198667, partial [Aspergillus navahoensis]